MEIKISCYSCGQHVVVVSSAGGSMVNCPGCGTELIIPEVLIEPSSQVPEPSPVPPVSTRPQPVYIQPQPRQQRSIGWGVFWGLFGFFIILPLVVGTVLLLVGVGLPAFFVATRAAQEHAATIETNQPAAVASLRPADREKAAKLSYIKNDLMLYEFRASFHDSVLDGTVPGVDFKLKNTGRRTLREVEVTVYFKDRSGATIWEERFFPVLVTAYGADNEPLKPGFIWQMERRKFYAAKKVPSEWDASQTEARVTNIEFAKEPSEQPAPGEASTP